MPLKLFADYTRFFRVFFNNNFSDFLILPLNYFKNFSKQLSYSRCSVRPRMTINVHSF